ncbi:MAG: hypothetical protein AAF997_15730 [Myxococcota bacterium]
MRIPAYGYLGVVAAGMLMVGCGDSAETGGTGGAGGNGGAGGAGGVVCPVGEVECDEVCIPDFEPTLTDLQTNVFDQTCAFSACHDADAPAANLELTSVTVSADNLIDVPSIQVPGRARVVPGEVESSYLINKIRGVDIAPGTGLMPLGGPPLCEVRMLAVEEWVAAGAPID